MLATYLVSVTGSSLTPAFYLMAAAVVTFVVVATIPETARIPLQETRALPRKERAERGAQEDSVRGSRQRTLSIRGPEAERGASGDQESSQPRER